MASENSTDSFDIDIEFIEYAPQYDCYSADITNFDGEGSVCSGNYFSGTKSYRYFQVGGGPAGDCLSIGAFKAWHHLNGKIEMSYYYFKDSDPNQEINKHIFGRKLN